MSDRRMSLEVEKKIARRAQWDSYGVALFSTALALAIALPLGSLIKPTPASLFFMAVMVSAWYGGLRPGLVATVLSTLAVNYCFIEPYYSLKITDLGSIIRLGVYTTAALLISGLSESRRIALRQEQKLRAASEAAQGEVQATKERLETVLSSIDDGFYVLDRDWRYTYVNDRLCEIVRMPREALLGQNIWELFTDIANTDVYAQFHYALNEQTPLQFEYLYLPWNCWYEHRVYPSPDGLTIFIADITDRKRAEAALIAQEQRYRYIFEGVNVSIWEEDFSEVKAAISQLKTAGVQNFRQYLTEHPEFVQQAVGMVRLRDLNQASLQLFGAQSKAELLNSLHQIFTPETQDAFIGELLAIAAEEPYFAAETLLQTLQGDRLHVWFTITFPPPSDLYDRVLVSLLDISDLKRAEADLRQKNAILNVISESTSTLIYAKDQEGRMLLANASVLNAVGLPESEVLGRTSLQFQQPREAAEQVMENDRAVMESGQTLGFEEIVNTPAGQRVFFSVKSPYRNDVGDVIGLIGVSTDISDRVQLERDRERILQQEQAAREAAEDANRIKDEFLAVLSHELRSPLNPILGWSKLLINGKLDPIKTKQALETIERNAKLQAELIEDLLDVSRILRGKLNLTVRPIHLVSIVQAAMETVRLAAESKRIDLRFAGSRGVMEWESNGVKVMGDPTRLQQVVWNLLSNAVKFTPAGGRVEVRLERVDGGDRVDRGDRGDGGDGGVISSSLSPSHTSYAQIRVTDTGKGIAPDFLPHVFEYFRQEDGATTRKFGGLGLGLAIVRHLVELHGGTIEAYSPGEGLGAIFTVRLPLFQRTEKEGLGALARSTQHSPLRTPLAGLRILIADDDTDTREFLAFLVRQAGASVVAVDSAGAALTALVQFQPDVLLSDIGMPDMDGYMLLRKIRALSPGQGGQIPAIALTAYAGDYDQQQALEVGFQRHISKPVEPEVLIRAIVMLTGRTMPTSP